MLTKLTNHELVTAHKALATYDVQLSEGKVRHPQKKAVRGTLERLMAAIESQVADNITDLVGETDGAIS